MVNSSSPLLILAPHPAPHLAYLRWDDDVVFKNCAKGQDDDKKDRFINDTIRSEFHKKFMSKYIR